MRDVSVWSKLHFTEENGDSERKREFSVFMDVCVYVCEIGSREIQVFGLDGTGKNRFLLCPVPCPSEAMFVK